jgi:hypothetical protein
VVNGDGTTDIGHVDEIGSVVSIRALRVRKLTRNATRPSSLT